MEISQIIYAVALAEHLNFSRAAEKLYIAQPTLSQQVRKLEKALGFSIFYRNTKNVELTEAGKIFIKEAKAMVSSYRQLESTCDEIGNAFKSSVSFGTSIVTLSEATANIPLFMELFPNTKLIMVEAWDEDLKQMLIDGTLDIAFVLLTGKEDLRNFQVTPLRKDYVCVTVGANHRLAKKESVVMKDLVNERMIFSNERSSFKKSIMNEFGEANLKPQKVMHVSMFEARVPIISQGDAISITLHAQGKMYEDMNIVTIPIEPRMYRMHTLCTKAGVERSLLVESLIEILKQGDKKSKGTRNVNL